MFSKPIASPPGTLPSHSFGVVGLETIFYELTTLEDKLVLGNTSSSTLIIMTNRFAQTF